MAEQEAGARLRALADTAATFHTDQHIPIRRYYRWGIVLLILILIQPLLSFLPSMQPGV